MVSWQKEGKSDKGSAGHVTVSGFGASSAILHHDNARHLAARGSDSGQVGGDGLLKARVFASVLEVYLLQVCNGRQSTFLKKRQVAFFVGPACFCIVLHIFFLFSSSVMRPQRHPASENASRASSRDPELQHAHKALNQRRGGGYFGASPSTHGFGSDGCSANAKRRQASRSEGSQWQ
ncbi:hypothetical protein B0J13DRAFT_655280 [Dactylonectria estremocensis]|uniref:Transmembrane protein n=1 Tax=Dactylonectria estremocensis TaxID=1079267 RepID=A0A9P9JEY7_9HYPO|nr:hypothetical protein B0J13DRAFT_655280 [Dactylonectria estremocensis]